MADINPIEIKNFAWGISVDDSYWPENGFYYWENIDIKNSLGRVKFNWAHTQDFETRTPNFWWTKLFMVWWVKLWANAIQNIYYWDQYRTSQNYQPKQHWEMFIGGGTISKMISHLWYLYTFRTDWTVSRFLIDNNWYWSFESKWFGSLSSNKVVDADFDSDTWRTVWAWWSISWWEATHTSWTNVLSQSLTNLTSKVTITDTTTATDTFNKTSHWFINWDLVFFVAWTWSLPTWVTAYTPYYIINSLTDTFQISTTLWWTVKTFKTDWSSFDCYDTKYYRIAVYVEAFTTGSLDVKMWTQTQITITPTTSNYVRENIRKVRSDTETLEFVPSTDFNGSLRRVTVQEDINKEFLLDDTWFGNLIYWDAVITQWAKIFAWGSDGKFYEIDTILKLSKLIFDIPEAIKFITKIWDIYRIYSTDWINTILYMWKIWENSPIYSIKRDNIVVNSVVWMWNYDYMITRANNKYTLYKCAEFEKQPISKSWNDITYPDRKTKLRFNQTTNPIIALWDEIFIWAYNRLYSYWNRKPWLPSAINVECNVWLDTYKDTTIIPLLVDDNYIYFWISWINTTTWLNTYVVSYLELWESKICSKRQFIQTMPIIGSKRDSTLQVSKIWVSYSYNDRTSDCLITTYAILDNNKVKSVSWTWNKTIEAYKPIKLSVWDKIKFRWDSYYNEYWEFTVATVIDDYRFTITETNTNIESWDFIMIKLFDILDKDKLNISYNVNFDASQFSLVFENNRTNTTTAPELNSYTLYMSEKLNDS